MDGSLSPSVRALIWCAVLFVFALIAPRFAAAQGELDAVRQAVRDEPARLPDDDRPYHGQHCHDSYTCCDDDDNWSLWAELTLWTITAPWWGPHSLVDAGLGVPGYFPARPYCDSEWGYMTFDPCSPTARDSATRLSIEYGTDFDRIDRFGGRVLWESTSRFGVDADVRRYEEERRFFGDDSLWTGDVNCVFRFAQSDCLVMRSGIGLNWLADDRRTDAGFNFTYGGDLFPSDPWVVSAEIDLGTLGDAGLFHARITGGVLIEHAELYVGFDRYAIGGVDLGGVIAGVRTWF